MQKKRKKENALINPTDWVNTIIRLKASLCHTVLISIHSVATECRKSCLLESLQCIMHIFFPGISSHLSFNTPGIRVYFC